MSEGNKLTCDIDGTTLDELGSLTVTARTTAFWWKCANCNRYWWLEHDKVRHEGVRLREWNV